MSIRLSAPYQIVKELMNREPDKCSLMHLACDEFPTKHSPKWINNDFIVFNLSQDIFDINNKDICVGVHYIFLRDNFDEKQYIYTLQELSKDAPIGLYCTIYNTSDFKIITNPKSSTLTIDQIFNDIVVKCDQIIEKFSLGNIVTKNYKENEITYVTYKNRGFLIKLTKS